MNFAHAVRNRAEPYKEGELRMLNRVWVFSTVGYAVMVAVACGKSSTVPISIPAEQGIATPTPTPAPDTSANIPAAGEFGSSLSTSRAFASLLTLTNPQSLNCDSKNSGQTVYVRSDATFSYCNGSSWEAIDLHGPAGAAGSQGVTGLQGLQGVQGAQGPAGSVGSQGPQGIAGATGPTGATGAAGAQGPAGATGVQGPRGYPALMATTSEAAGANCPFGGSRVQTGYDDGNSGGSAQDGVMSAGEIRQTFYYCNNQQTLKVYSSSNVALGYYLGNVTVPMTYYSAVNTSVGNGILVRGLTSDIYTIYYTSSSQSGSTNSTDSQNSISSSNQRIYLWGNINYLQSMTGIPVFSAGNCTGSVSISIDTRIINTYYVSSHVLAWGRMKNFYFAYSTQGHEFKFSSDALADAVSFSYQSYLRFDGVCVAASGTVWGRPITMGQNLFPAAGSLGEWYLAP